VIRELQIIFGLDPVSREPGIARHARISGAGGIAALAIVPVARLSAEVSGPAHRDARRRPP
jgi:hypothetical protein